MRKIPASVEYEGVVIGEAEIQYKDSDPVRPCSTYLFCPKCGSLWASIKVPSYISKRHVVSYIACKNHGGGVLDDLPPVGFYEHRRFPILFSDSVLMHDFVVMYDYWLEGKIEPYQGDVDSGFPVSAGSNSQFNVSSFFLRAVGKETSQ